MGVSPRGLIKQTIVEDAEPMDAWDYDSSTAFIVNLLNIYDFRRFTNIPRPNNRRHPGDLLQTWLSLS